MGCRVDGEGISRKAGEQRLRWGLEERTARGSS